MESKNNFNDLHSVVETLKGDWLEVLSDNHVNLFHSVGRETVDGNLGTVLQNNANDQYYWFVPDYNAHGTYPNYIRQRTGASGTWGYFQKMFIMSYENRRDPRDLFRFYFNYQGNPDDRHDLVAPIMERQNRGFVWFELFPNKSVRIFHEVGKETVEGNTGRVIRADDTDFYLFIPDANAHGTYPSLMRQRNGENGAWMNFQIMLR